METQIIILTASFFISIILGLIIIPILRKLKVGQIERDDGPQSHLKKKGTPTMGGIIMIMTMIVVIIGIYIYMNIQGDIAAANKILPILLISIGFGLIGFIDDFKKLVLKNTKGLKPMYKILGLLIISVIYIVYMIYGAEIGTQTYIPIIKQYIEIPIILYIPFAIIVMLGTTNAINLTDGIDGLASSVSAVIITFFTIVGFNYAVPEISMFTSIILGAVLGFLIFNIHPAKVFMGDTGSLLIGGAISTVALYLKMPIILIVVALIPVLETLSVMIQVAYFKKTGKRIFKMAPLHHHFELSGWNENKVVIIFTIMTLVLSIIGIQII